LETIVIKPARLISFTSASYGRLCRLHLVRMAYLTGVTTARNMSGNRNDPPGRKLWLCLPGRTQPGNRRSNRRIQLTSWYSYRVNGPISYKILRLCSSMTFVLVPYISLCHPECGPFPITCVILEEGECPTKDLPRIERHHRSDGTKTIKNCIQRRAFHLFVSFSMST
jgi:hypothetical protein